jgi:hypothetical protein
MNILQILGTIAAYVPGLAQIITQILVAIHAVPGTPEHTEAITAPVTPAPPTT